jgi:hypothetical protein
VSSEETERSEGPERLMTRIVLLPNAVLELIWSWLSVRQQCSQGNLVCRRWRLLTKRGLMVLHRLCHRDFFQPYALLLSYAASEAICFVSGAHVTYLRLENDMVELARFENLRHLDLVRVSPKFWQLQLSFNFVLDSLQLHDMDVPAEAFGEFLVSTRVKALRLFLVHDLRGLSRTCPRLRTLSHAHSAPIAAFLQANTQLVELQMYELPEVKFQAVEHAEVSHFSVCWVFGPILRRLNLELADIAEVCAFLARVVAGCPGLECLRIASRAILQQSDLSTLATLPRLETLTLDSVTLLGTDFSGFRPLRDLLIAPSSAKQHLFVVGLPPQLHRLRIQHFESTSLSEVPDSLETVELPKHCTLPRNRVKEVHGFSVPEIEQLRSQYPEVRRLRTTLEPVPHQLNEIREAGLSWRAHDPEWGFPFLVCRFPRT